jgi:hypothetical protein
MRRFTASMGRIATFSSPKSRPKSLLGRLCEIACEEQRANPFTFA